MTCSSTSFDILDVLDCFLDVFYPFSCLNLVLAEHVWCLIFPHFAINIFRSTSPFRSIDQQQKPASCTETLLLFSNNENHTITTDDMIYKFYIFYIIVDPRREH